DPVLHRTRLKLVSQTNLSGVAIGMIRGLLDRIAVVTARVGYRQQPAEVDLMKDAMSIRGIDGELIGEVILGPDGSRCVVTVAVFPGLLLIDAQVRRRRNRNARQDGAISHRRIEIQFLIAEVKGEPQAIAAIIKRER